MYTTLQTHGKMVCASNFCRHCDKQLLSASGARGRTPPHSQTVMLSVRRQRPTHSEALTDAHFDSGCANAVRAAALPTVSRQRPTHSEALADADFDSDSGVTFCRCRHRVCARLSSWPPLPRSPPLQIQTRCPQCPPLEEEECSCYESLAPQPSVPSTTEYRALSTW